MTSGEITTGSAFVQKWNSPLMREQMSLLWILQPNQEEKTCSYQLGLSWQRHFKVQFQTCLSTFDFVERIWIFCSWLVARWARCFASRLTGSVKRVFTPTSPITDVKSYFAEDTCGGFNRKFWSHICPHHSSHLYVLISQIKFTQLKLSIFCKSYRCSCARMLI